MDVWPSAQHRLNLPRLCVRLRKYHKERQPKGFEFEIYLRSQIVSLRAFSAFWLTAAKPVPLKMANTCVIRTLSAGAQGWATRPECLADAGSGQLSQTLLRGTSFCIVAATEKSQ